MGLGLLVDEELAGNGGERVGGRGRARKGEDVLGSSVNGSSSVNSSASASSIISCRVGLLGSFPLLGSPLFIT